MKRLSADTKGYVESGLDLLYNNRRRLSTDVIFIPLIIELLSAFLTDEVIEPALQ